MSVKHLWGTHLLFSGEGGVDTSATGTKQCEAITNVAIRIMRVKGMDEQ